MAQGGEMHVSGRNRGITEFNLASVFATDEERSALTMVRSLDLACNHLKEVRTLQPLVSLNSLDVCWNQLISLSGLPLGLTRLHVAHNNLRSLEGIAALPNLQELDISHNKLQSLAGLSVGSPLVVLKASHNRLAKVPHLDVLSKLRVLELDANYLASADTLGFLESLLELQTATFLGNPVVEMNDYRALVQRLCPSLASLDGVPTMSDAGVEVSAVSASLSPQERFMNNSRRSTASSQIKRSGESFPKRSMMRSSLVERTLGSTSTVADQYPSDTESTNASALSNSVLHTKMDDRRRDLAAQLDQQNRRVRSLEVDLELSYNENKKLKKECHTLHKQLSEVRRVMSDELDEVSTLRKENERLREELLQSKEKLGKALRDAKYAAENVKHNNHHVIEELERRNVQLEHENQQIIADLQRLSFGRDVSTIAPVEEDVPSPRSASKESSNPPTSAPLPSDVASELKRMMMEQLAQTSSGVDLAEDVEMPANEAKPADRLEDIAPSSTPRSSKKSTAVKGVKELWEKHEAVIAKSKGTFHSRSPYSPQGPR